MEACQLTNVPSVRGDFCILIDMMLIAVHGATYGMILSVTILTANSV